MAIAARFDQFALIQNTKVGEALKEQVEDRLKFFSSGEKPKTNRDVMKDVLDELKEEGLYVTAEDSDKGEEKTKKSMNGKDKKDKKEKKSKKNKKRKHSEVEEQDMEVDEPVKEKKKKKKSKKSKKQEDDDE